MGSYTRNSGYDGSLCPVPEDVLQKSRCALCRLYLSCGPLLVLQKIGTICGRCSPPPENQPIFHNKAAERFLSSMRFPCAFRDRGCKKSDFFNYITQHEDRCLFQFYHCPFVSCTWKGPVLVEKRHLEKHEEMWGHQMHPCLLESCTWRGTYLNRWEHLETVHPKHVLKDNKIVLDTSRDFMARFFGKVVELVYGIVFTFDANKEELTYSVYHPARKNLQCFCKPSNYAQHDCWVHPRDEALKISGGEVSYYSESLLDMSVSSYYDTDKVLIAVNFRSAETFSLVD